MKNKINYSLKLVEHDGDYELLDTGDRAKLERYGDVVLARPDPEALWKKADETAWDKADARFVRKGSYTKWMEKKELSKEWQIKYGGFTFLIRPTTYKHTGIFPEQLENWKWLAQQVRSNKEKRKDGIKVLNLFAYTGGASLAAVSAGAEVTHVDASKVAVSWARENAKLSGLGDAPIRYIVEDCIQFLKREIKRGNKYDGIIMDPPAFGHGPSGELWKIEEDFLHLFELCKQVFSDKPLFILINGYASGYSSIAYYNNLTEIFKSLGGSVEVGELALLDKNFRPLPAGIFARWQK